MRRRSSTILAFWFVGANALAIAGCRTPAGNASATKDLPAALLPSDVNQYRSYTPQQLADAFANGASPTSLPSGYAVGIHIIPPGSPASVPMSLTVATKTLWKGKRFDGANAIMYDDTLGPDLGTKSVLSVEPMAAALARHGFDPQAGSSTVDERPSLITDYAASVYGAVGSATLAATKGWIDEFRELSQGSKPMYIGRSTYKGKFWGYVILQIDPQNVGNTSVFTEAVSSIARNACALGNVRSPSSVVCGLLASFQECSSAAATCLLKGGDTGQRSYVDQEAWRSLQSHLPESYRFTDAYKPREDYWTWHGHTIHLDRFENPDAKARVILLHGVGTNGRQMSLILGGPLAKRGYDTVAIDAPGYGLTTIAAGALVTYDDWVQMVSDFAASESARDGKPIFLYGLSAGGKLTYDAAALNKHVAGIVGMTFLDERDQTVRDTTFTSMFMSRIGVNGVALAAQTPLASLQVPVSTVGKMNTLANDPEVLKIMLADPTSAGNFATLKFLSTYVNYKPAVEPESFNVCPVLLTQPEKDHWTPQFLADAFLKKLKLTTSKTVVLPDGGHFPVEESALSKLADAVSEFVDQTLAPSE